METSFLIVMLKNDGEKIQTSDIVSRQKSDLFLYNRNTKFKHS